MKAEVEKFLDVADKRNKISGDWHAARDIIRVLREPLLFLCGSEGGVGEMARDALKKADAIAGRDKR